VALLAIGMVLGGLLDGPADIALGQTEFNRFVGVAFPPVPCNLAVHSRIVTAEDGTAIASLTAAPPSPCTSLNLEILPSPADSADCVERAMRGRAIQVDCEFSADNLSTVFNFTDASD